MFKGPGKIVRNNKSSSYPTFELTGVNCMWKLHPLKSLEAVNWPLSFLNKNKKIEQKFGQKSLLNQIGIVGTSCPGFW